MHPDLEAVIAADEECRSRLTLAQSHRERDLADARARRDATIEKRRAAARDALEQELASIRAEGDSRLKATADQQRAYLASLAKAGEAQFDAAVEAYLAIVCGAEQQ